MSWNLLTTFLLYHSCLLILYFVYCVALWLWLLDDFWNSAKSKLHFCAGSNLCGMSEIHDGEDMWQWFQLEIRLNIFCQSTILQRQFIITISSVVGGIFAFVFGCGNYFLLEWNLIISSVEVVNFFYIQFVEVQRKIEDWLRKIYISIRTMLQNLHFLTNECTFL